MGNARVRCVMHEGEKASLHTTNARLPDIDPFKVTEEYLFNSTSDDDNERI